jgi:hypothetical protein
MTDSSSSGQSPIHMSSDSESDKSEAHEMSSKCEHRHGRSPPRHILMKRPRKGQDDHQICREEAKSCDNRHGGQRPKKVSNRQKIVTPILMRTQP